MKKKTLLQSSGFVTLCASLVCIVIGLLVGFLVLLLLGGEKAYSDGFKQILLGGFYMMPSGIGKEIVTAVPLIMCGLSVAFAFKTGLFNIGAAGQYTVGAFGGLVFALLLHAPWWLCLIASTVFGAVWGAIPGIFKAYLNVNEVITAIMFNWIGLYMGNDIMYGKGISKVGEILDLAVKYDIIHKSGAWFSYNENRLGQGRDNVKNYISEHPDFMAELEAQVRERLMAENNAARAAAKPAEKPTPAAEPAPAAMPKKPTSRSGAKAKLDIVVDDDD